MSKAFEEWWDQVGEIDRIDETCRAAWNAALTHAAKVCRDRKDAEIGMTVERCARAIERARDE